MGQDEDLTGPRRCDKLAGMLTRITKGGLAAMLALTLAPEAARGCACGCGVFNVATSSMFPQGTGGMAFFETDFRIRKHNWHADSTAPAANDGDKEIRSWFFTPGVQFMFNRSWGIQAEVPYDNRVFKTLGGADGNTLITEHWSQLGDIRLEGIYTGFSPDLSTGLTFGFKLPTGSFSHNDIYQDIDRDSEIGTGSTDVLLGVFHRGNVTKDNSVSWFAQGLLDVPTLTQAHYRPGVELDTAAGVVPQPIIARPIAHYAGGASHCVGTDQRHRPQCFRRRQ